MKISYLMSTNSRFLYGPGRLLGGRQMSYGQHSFITDFMISATRQGHHVTLAGENLHLMPTLDLISPVADIMELRYPSALEHADIIILDQEVDIDLDRVPINVPIITIIHNSWLPMDPLVVQRSHKIICLSEVARRRLSVIVPSAKLQVVHQGVDLNRFPELPSVPQNGYPLALVSGRLDGERGEVVLEAVRELQHVRTQIMLLGGGEGFWDAVTQFGKNIICIDYIPYHSMPRLLSILSLVISSGRGAMEALVSGIPTICLGFGYGGPVTRDNLASLLQGNLTGRGLECSLGTLQEDAEKLITYGRSADPFIRDCLNVQRFVDHVLDVGHGAQRPHV